MTPEELIAEQDATITELRAENAKLQDSLTTAQERIYHVGRGATVEEDSDGTAAYWEGVYDRIRAAWGRWALTELGTASPSPVDLEGRPELEALWESVR